MTQPTSVDVFVSPSGNAFMADIASWLVDAAGSLGCSTRLVDDGSLPGDHGNVAIPLVVAPHEFFELSHRSNAELLDAASRSIPVATEQPGTSWFERSAEWCSVAPWVLDINPAAADELLARGLDARWLRLGAVPAMDHRRAGERTVDVAVLAGLTDHRARRLAELAPALWRHRCDLRLFPTDRPIAAGGAPAGAARVGPVFGAAKYELLARSRIVLNLHRDESTSYFEWARVVEALANGCVVVCDPSGSIEPLVDGEHLVVTDDPATAIAELLDEPERLAAIGAGAATFVHGHLALADSLAPHLDAAADTLRRHRGARTVASPAPAVAATRRADDRGVRPAFRPYLGVRRRLLDSVVAERSLRREIDAARCTARHGDPAHLVEHTSESWHAARPDVSVIVTLFDYEHVVVEAIDSVAASTEVDLELIVVDDHSRDRGRETVRSWIDAHPELPALLVGRDANRGLAAARNLAIERSRADKVMVLDADNQLYPACLRRLADALDDDGGAAFAWSILEVFGASAGLMSAFGWDPSRLVERNHIDAQVMLRRAAWESIGGYREVDGLLVGWEDWDLWLRLLAQGGYGVFVPQILGRYRSQDVSMVTGPNRFNEVMLERFEAAHPSLSFPAR